MRVGLDPLVNLGQWGLVTGPRFSHYVGLSAGSYWCSCAPMVGLGVESQSFAFLSFVSSGSGEWFRIFKAKYERSFTKVEMSNLLSFLTIALVKVRKLLHAFST